MQKELNLKVKFRESFRPFAPSVLREDVNSWFDLNTDSPYMLMVADVKKSIQIPMSENDQKLFGIEKLNVKRSSIPAVTHVDYSARIQTVHEETNPKYHKLLKKFKDKALIVCVLRALGTLLQENIEERELLDESLEKFLQKTRVEYRKGRLRTFKEWIKMVRELLDELD